MAADISVGGIGSPSGYSTVLVRTDRGTQLFSKLMLENQIEELDKATADATQTKAKILSQIERLGQLKYDNGIKKRKQQNIAGGKI